MSPFPARRRWPACYIRDADEADAVVDRVYGFALEQADGRLRELFSLAVDDLRQDVLVSLM